MSTINVVKGPVFTRRFNVASGADSSIQGGTPVKASGSNVVAVADGDPEIGTDQLVGIAASDSTETTAENGFVDVRVLSAGVTVLRGHANTAANLADSILNNAVTFDVSGGDFTIDENEANDPDVHGLVIVGYDAEMGTVDVMVKSEATISGGAISA